MRMRFFSIIHFTKANGNPLIPDAVEIVMVALFGTINTKTTNTTRNLGGFQQKINMKPSGNSINLIANPNEDILIQGLHSDQNRNASKHALTVSKFLLFSIIFF